MKKIITSALLLGLMTIVTAQAQTKLARYGWKRWDVYSLVPVGAKIAENTEYVFEVDDDEYTMRMEWWDKDGVSSSEYGKYLIEGAKEAGMTNIQAKNVKSYTTAKKVRILYISGLDKNRNSIIFALISGGTKGLYLEYKLVYHSSNSATAFKMLYSVEMG